MEITVVGKIIGLSQYETEDYMLRIYENDLEEDNKVRVDYLDIQEKQRFKTTVPFIVIDNKIKFEEETKLTKNIQACLESEGWEFYKGEMTNG